MKKLLRRFRYWLIHILGGVIPEEAPHAVAVEQHSVHTIVACLDWHDFYLVDYQEREQTVIKRLSEKIAEVLARDKLLNISYSDRPLEQRRLYRASITIVDQRKEETP